MKIPLEPPDFSQVAKKYGDQFFRFHENPQVTKLLHKSLRDYPYWDHMRHWPMPNDIGPEVLWWLREMNALGRRSAIPLLDTMGKPFTYWLPDRAQEWLHRIDRNAAGTLHNEEDRLSSAFQDRIIISSLMEEAIASSQIEGAATTRRVAKQMLRSGRKPTDKSEQMILNNYHAIQKIRELKSLPLTVEMMHDLHQILTTDTLDEPNAAGRSRTSPQDDNIKVYDADETILHTPPRGSELQNRIPLLLSFANDITHDPFIHPVVKAILLHFWVGYDHPYIDGNGRMGRALFYWYLLKQGYWLFEYLSISRIVLRTSGQYKRAFLYSERGHNDVTYFLMYNLRVIDLALEEIRRHVAQKREELAQSAELLRKLRWTNHRQRELLLNSLKNPDREYTIEGHQSIHQIVYQTARTDLLTLVKKGLLIKTKGGRAFVFLPAKDLSAKLKLSL